MDHGYNGTPVTTWILGGLANQTFVPIAQFVPLAAWFDLALIAGLVLALWRLLGPEPALAFAALWALNPLNDYAFTGGAYLRHLYFVAVALGVALLARERTATGAGALAGASALRLFPALFPAAVVAHDLVNPHPARVIRANARFYAALAGVVLLLLAATLFQRTPEGHSSWSDFAERITAHAANLSPNRIGLPFALSVSSDHRLADISADDSGRNPLEWGRQMAATLEARAAVYYILLGLGALLSLAYLRSVPIACAVPRVAVALPAHSALALRLRAAGNPADPVRG